MHITRDIRVLWERCGKCGRWWGIELECYGHCPVCAQNTIRSLNENEGGLLEEMLEKDRTISALRGVITRMKRAAKGGPR